MASSLPAQAASPEEGFQLLKEKPPAGEIKKLYVPYDAGTGWFIHNTTREELILVKLRECENIKATVVPVCEQAAVPPMPAKERAFWQHPLFIFGVASMAAVLGYGMGLDKRNH